MEEEDGAPAAAAAVPPQDEEEEEEEVLVQGEEVDVDMEHPPEEEDDDEDDDMHMAALRVPLEDHSIATLACHKDAVYSVALSPPGVPLLVLTGGGDDTAFLSRVDLEYSTPSGISASIVDSVELKGHTDSVSCCGFSADGQLAATGAYDGQINIYATGSGEKVACLEGPDDIEWLAWHGQGNVIAGAGVDGAVWMWLAATGECMRVFAGHQARVSCGYFTSNGRNLVTGSEDGSVRVWAPKTGECRYNMLSLSCYRFPPKAFTHLAHFSPFRHAFNPGRGFHEGPVTCLAVHPDAEQGHMVLSGGADGTVCLLHLKNSRVMACFDHDGSSTATPISGGEKDREASTIVSVDFCLSHQWVASACTAGVLKVWDIQSGICRHSLPHPAAITQLSWLGQTIQVATSCADGSLRVWDARGGDCLRQMQGHTDMILAFAVRLVKSILAFVLVLGLPLTFPPPSDFRLEEDQCIVASASDDFSSKIFAHSLS
jgi:WD40 repeat protein